MYILHKRFLENRDFPRISILRFLSQQFDMHLHGQTFDVLCMFLPASSEAWVPGVMWTSIWGVKEKSLVKIIIIRILQYIFIYQQTHKSRWYLMSIFYIQANVLWTCPARSAKAWPWWTDQWVSPCCSGGLWEWTRLSQYSPYHWPENNHTHKHQNSSCIRKFTQSSRGNYFVEVGDSSTSMPP